MSTLFVFDIDGTIANGERRFKQAGPEPSRDDREQYDRWCRIVNTGIEDDIPVLGMWQLVFGVLSEGRAIYLTSREEQHREVTRAWLHKHNFPVVNVPLVMRPNGNYVHTPDLKESFINALKRDGDSVVVVDDDEHGTIEAMCKRNGWTFLKARSGGQR